MPFLLILEHFFCCCLRWASSSPPLSPRLDRVVKNTGFEDGFSPSPLGFCTYRATGCQSDPSTSLSSQGLGKGQRHPQSQKKHDRHHPLIIKSKLALLAV